MLKGKIDKELKLWIARPKTLVPQKCKNDKFRLCSGYCPQFGEPTNIDPRDNVISKRTIYLQICEQRILEFDELIDERPKE